MRDLTQHLTSYAAYHRDRRNIATHFVGIPMITVAVAALLGAAHPYAAYAVFGAATLYYLVLDLRLGLAMAAYSAASLAAGLPAGLIGGIVLFVVGWVIQFIGHYYEGKKPAFVDDLSGLLIGPLFIVTELGFMLGMRRPLREAIESKTGPTRINPRPGTATASR
ncbi:MAG: DUF962 domain-containing protein [Myxococcaceae bacterium]|nr:DUF962 domain-containing protein [Myxococcaceae bacterium]